MTGDVWTDWNPELAEAIAQRDSARNWAVTLEADNERLRDGIREERRHHVRVGPTWPSTSANCARCRGEGWPCFSSVRLESLLLAPLAVVETP